MKSLTVSVYLATKSFRCVLLSGSQCNDYAHTHCLLADQPSAGTAGHEGEQSCSKDADNCVSRPAPPADPHQKLCWKNSQPGGCKSLLWACTTCGMGGRYHSQINELSLFLSH